MAAAASGGRAAPPSDPGSAGSAGSAGARGNPGRRWYREALEDVHATQALIAETLAEDDDEPGGDGVRT